MKKFYAIFLAFSITLILSACGSSKNLFRDQDPVPADFGKQQTTVLVLKTEQNKVNRALESTFKKYYTGPFLLIDEEDLTSGKYSDNQKYRYCFRTHIQFQAASGSGSMRTQATHNYTYDIVDRVTATKNGLDFYGGGYKGLMEAYVKKMEAVKAENSK
ncbi:MAG TPA: hypothetical protein VFR58_11470 [Flavisolibacter sp.]|nr:hypothetical protein [Flavisolibacter sp.]